MVSQSYKKMKKASCILFAVLILWMTPACDYLDAVHIKKVEAASVAVGVTAVSLLKVTAAAFGVVIAAGAASKAADSFSEWLNKEGTAEAVATWNQAQANAQSLAISAGFAGDVRRWLESRFSSLTSGEVASATIGAGEITNGVECVFPDLEATFRAKYLTGRKLYYIFAVDVTQSSSSRLTFYYNTFGTYSSAEYDSYSSYYLISSETGSMIYWLNTSGTVSAFFNENKMIAGSFNPSSLELSAGSYVNSFFSAIPFNSSDWRIFTNFPVIVTDFPENVASGSLFSVILSHATATYNLDASVTLGTSFGSFSDSNLAKLATLKLTATGIDQIQAAVDQAVSDHTSTDESGNLVYTPDISQAIIDAYNQGLTDAENGSGTVVDPDQPDDPDTPVVPDTGILPFLQGLKDSLMDWITAIPEAVASGAGVIKDTLETGWTTLWGHLTGLKDTLMEISGTVSLGFQEVVSGITDIPQTLDGLFLDLHDWIMDIPAVITDGFSMVQEQMENLIAAFPDADTFVLPITDAISDALTIDVDAVQEAVEAEQTELWNVPFLVKAKEVYDGFSFPADVTYPKIKIETPEILRSYYEEPEIILLDFEDYKDYCLWARLLFRASIWLWLIWHIVVLMTPKLRIS